MEKHIQLFVRIQFIGGIMSLQNS